MKKKTLIKSTLLSMAPLVLSTSLIIDNIEQINSINLLEKNNSTLASQNLNGFNLKTHSTIVKDVEIFQGGFKSVDHYAPIGADELRQITNRPKLHASSEYFTINLVERNINNQTKTFIKTTSLLSETNDENQYTEVPFDLLNIASMQYVSNTLWILGAIVVISPDDVISYQFQLLNFKVEMLETGKPKIELIDTFENVMTFDDFIQYHPSLVPVYYLNENGEITMRDHEVLIMTQNKSFNELGAGGQFQIKKYEKQSNQPLIETNIEIGKFTSQESNDDAKILAMHVIDKNLASASNPNYSMNIYHTLTQAGQNNLALSNFENGQFNQTIYNESIPNVIDDMNHLMTYPKFVKNEQNYELLWVFADLKQEVNVTKMFSTTLNSQFQPLSILQQAKVVDLAALEQRIGQFTFIDYHNHGMFSDGSIYVPMKFIKNGVSNQAILNWKDSTNAAYWNTINDQQLLNSLMYIDQIQAPGFDIEDYEAASNLTFLEKIVVNENQEVQLTYLTPNINPNNLNVYYQQTYIIEQAENKLSNKLRLNYNTSTPSEIVIDIPYEQGIVDENQLVDEIWKVSRDYLKTGFQTNVNDSIVAVPNTLKHASENGIDISTLDVTFPGGVYINGVLDQSQAATTKTFELIYQPSNNFLPLQVQSKQQIDDNYRSSQLVAKIDAIANNTLIDKATIEKLKQANIIGDLNSDAEIKMTKYYLNHLIGISAAADDLNGSVSLILTFIDVNNEVQQRSATITGFYSERLAIEKEKVRNQTIIISSSIAGVSVFIITLISVIFYLKNKKKQAMVASLKVGMNLNQKMNNPIKFDPKKLSKPIDANNNGAKVNDQKTQTPTLPIKK